jgi:hypothetical protein
MGINHAFDQTLDITQTNASNGPDARREYAALSAKDDWKIKPLYNIKQIIDKFVKSYTNIRQPV